ncbi:MAG: hypothetical protein LBU05_04505, partial [Bifidobacteriaceae bacterium]|nr:hypothetical protein [Bifidobacteriaceae bacterium]
MTTMGKRFAAILLSVIVMGAVALVGQVVSPNIPEAGAAGYTYYAGDGVHIRRGSSTSHVADGMGYRTHQAYTYYWKLGQSVSG